MTSELLNLLNYSSSNFSPETFEIFQNFLQLSKKPAIKIYALRNVKLDIMTLTTIAPILLILMKKITAHKMDLRSQQENPGILLLLSVL